MSWKPSHASRHHKPWLYPEQITLPHLVSDDIASINELQKSAAIDETSISENEIENDQKDIDNDD